MIDLRAAWQPHEDPSGYRVEYVYGDDGTVIALRLIRKADEKVIGDFTSPDDLLAAAEADRLAAD